MAEKEKREPNIPAIFLMIFGGIAIFLVSSFVYLSLNGPDYSDDYTQKIASGEIKNPIEEFALQFSEKQEQIPAGAEVIIINTEEGEKKIIIQADLGDLNVADVEKELVKYSAILLKIYNLHEIPFFGTTPKVQVNIDSSSYTLEIKKGNILIKEGAANKPDITLTTTHEEIFKMIENNSYISDSLSSEKTTIELKANKLILFAKGYLGLYNDFGGSITGNMII